MRVYSTYIHIEREHVCVCVRERELVCACMWRSKDSLSGVDSHLLPCGFLGLNSGQPDRQ